MINLTITLVAELGTSIAGLIGRSTSKNNETTNYFHVSPVSCPLACDYVTLAFAIREWKRGRSQDWETKRVNGGVRSDLVAICNSLERAWEVKKARLHKVA